MASSQIYIARDDAGGKGLTLGGGQWSSGTDQYWFGGSTVWPGFSVNSSSPTGSMSFSFQGTAVALYGNSPAKGMSQNFQVAIDGASSYTTSTTDPNPQTWMQWYQSPEMSDGLHTITVNDMPGTGIDLILITPGPETPLDSQILMIDDTYSGITFKGDGWKEERDRRFKEGDVGITALAFQNGTHQTATAGDSLSFSYTGTDMQLFGIFQPSVAGSISLSYSVDNGTALQKEYTGSGSTGGDLFNYLLVDTGTLAAGNHTVTVNLTGVSLGQTLIVDYILYTPSFKTLSTMPDLTAAIPPKPSQSLSQSVSPSETASTSDSTSSIAASPISASVSSKTPPGAIAGAVAGGVILVAILAFLSFWLRSRRRHARRMNSESNERLDHGQRRTPRENGHVEQFAPEMQEQSVSTPTSGKGSFRGAPLSPLSPEGHQPPYGLPEASPALGSLPSAGTVDSSLAVARRRDEISRRLRELTELVVQTEMHDNITSPGLSYMSSPTLTMPSTMGRRDTRRNSEDVVELRRRIAELTAENERLAIVSEPPAYGEN